MSGPTPKDALQAEYLANRLLKNEKVLRRWARSEGIEALRLYDLDIPEIPLAIERFGLGAEAALVMWLYERPYRKDEEEEAAWLRLMGMTAAEALGIDRKRVFAKRRKHMRGLEQYERLTSSSATMTVRESGLAFEVNLSDYLDTGLFLDHRPARAAVGRAAEGRRVLNLFSYTGGFSVHAAAGGASEVVSVDLSNTYNAWAERNFSLNGLDSRRRELVKADCLDFLGRAAARGRTWDLVVCDPPTFSNSSMMESDFDLLRDWPLLLSACARVLEPGGAMLFSTNARRLKFDPSLVDLPCLDVSEASVPKDFRDRRIHRCWLLGDASTIAFT